MDRFTDTYMPDRIAAFAWVSLPTWSTSTTTVASGAERPNQNWVQPKHTFTSPGGVRCWEDVAALHEFWWAMRGPVFTFAMRDPLDCASRRMAKPNVPPVIFPTDQALGDGDGLTTEFQLTKTYLYGGRMTVRTIYHPVVDSVVLAINALPLDDPSWVHGPYEFTVSRTTGKVVVNPPLDVGMHLTAGFLFDVEARWQDDNSYSGMVQAFEAGGFADLNFVEVTPC